MKKTMCLVLVLALGLAAGAANGDFTLGTPTNLGLGVNSSVADITPSVSADGISLYFASERALGYGGRDDIWVAPRETTEQGWEAPINIGPIVNSSACEVSPSLSADGLALFFCDGVWGVTMPRRPGGHGDVDVWVTTRGTTDGEWRAPVNLGSVVNGSAYDGEPDISHDGLSLYFSSDRPGGYGGLDLWVATRATKGEEWGAPFNLGPNINTSSSDGDPSISADGLTLFFASGRGGGQGGFDLWVTTRRTKYDDWGSPVNLGPIVNSSGHDWGPEISADGSTVYFCVNRPGGIGYYDLWEVPVTPVVDFDGDGIVDLSDLSKLAQYWHENERSVDIAPPIGNGIIDAQDVAVFAEHWLEGAGPIAHWKLDETEGGIAHDSVGDKDGVVNGDPVWRPTGGKVDGALQFEGTDDYVSTLFVLNPADGAFSIFAWIKGGAPGEVVISQIDGATWLSADSSEGKLTTNLSAPAGRFPPQALTSQSVITDGQWHRVGFTWDGSNRILYVDDAEVAKDTQNELAGSTGGLYIGAGKDREAGSFWSGLIDDVRIYNRAVTP